MNIVRGIGWIAAGRVLAGVAFVGAFIAGFLMLVALASGNALALLLLCLFLLALLLLPLSAALGSWGFAIVLPGSSFMDKPWLWMVVAAAVPAAFLVLVWPPSAPWHWYVAGALVWLGVVLTLAAIIRISERRGAPSGGWDHVRFTYAWCFLVLGMLNNRTA